MFGSNVNTNIVSHINNNVNVGTKNYNFLISTLEIKMEPL